MSLEARGRCGVEVFFFTMAQQPPSGPGPLHYRGFTITLRHTPRSVGLLWTSDQPDAETFTWKYRCSSCLYEPRRWIGWGSRSLLGCCIVWKQHITVWEPQDRSGRVWKTENHLSLPVFETRTVQPVASHTDYATATGDCRGLLTVKRQQKQQLLNTVGLRVRIPPGAWMSVCCPVCCQVEVPASADPSPREVLMSVVWLSVIAKPW
jgi:hypothetical protein